MFDTFFEALLLMISVTGIIFFFEEKNMYCTSCFLKNEYRLLENALLYLYPLTLVFGFYIILNGSVSPGGGFQGGAILSAVFMSRYFVNPGAPWHTDILKNLEKTFYIVIIVLSLTVILYDNSLINSNIKSIYLYLMNFLIGIKVFSGLSIIFFYFAYIDTSLLPEEDTIQ